MNELRQRRAQDGFTLIELIITIVIIGILAAVAIPKFQDLTNDANKGVASGYGAALASASSVNYARTAGSTGGVRGINTCAGLATAGLADPPSGFTTGSVGGAALPTDGTTGTCTISYGTAGATVSFQAYGSPT